VDETRQVRVEPKAVQEADAESPPAPEPTPVPRDAAVVAPPGDPGPDAQADVPTLPEPEAVAPAPPASEAEPIAAEAAQAPPADTVTPEPSGAPPAQASEAESADQATAPNLDDVRAAPPPAPAWERVGGPSEHQSSTTLSPLDPPHREEGKPVAADHAPHPPAPSLETGGGPATSPEVQGVEPLQSEALGETQEEAPSDILPGEAGEPNPLAPAETVAAPIVSEIGDAEEPSPTVGERPAAPEFEPTPPLARVAVPDVDPTEADIDAPAVATDEGQPAASEPIETKVAAAAEAAEPADGRAEAIGEAQPLVPPLPDAEPPQPQATEVEVANAPTLPWAEPIAAAAPPASSPRESMRRADPASTPSLPSRDTMRDVLPYVRLALKGVAALALGYVALILTLVVLYRWVDPPISSLMLGQRLTGMPIERRWVPLERMSPHLIKAVILSEDGGFCRHRGVDLTALGEAIESDRGGSTITMQVVKNLFLWPSRSYVRKVIEICLAYVVEMVWPKRRILEIYLNIAEWGDGVFGAEAAARRHFLKSAARLTEEEAALLAVSLPNPLERMPASPSTTTRRLAMRLLTRMKLSQASLVCVRTPRRVAAHLFEPRI
jgi:monofunctional glycosyltransferase